MSNFTIDLPPSPCQEESNLISPSKHHSQEADELDFLCRKLSDVRVRHRQGVEDEDIRLSDVSDEQFRNLLSSISTTQANEESQRATVIKFRKLLAHDDIHPYLQKIVDSGIVPIFISLLSHRLPELQFESAWILTNIAAGTSSQTLSIIESDGLPALINLLSSSPFKEIREQCVWCLGNIAGDSAPLREMIVNYGGLEELVALITREMNEFLASESFMTEMVTSFNGSRKKTHNYNLSTLRISIWALSNFCRGNGKSQLDWNLIDIAMPILSQVITCCAPGSPHADDEIVMDACWALSRTLRGIHEGVEKIIVGGEVCRKLGALICYENTEIQLPALRCLINIVSGCDAQTQVVVDSDILPCLHSLLRSSDNETIKKETCLIISNITAGTKNQVQAVIDCQIIPTLIELLQNAEFKIKREACWAIGNATLNKDFYQVETILNSGSLPPMFSLISPEMISITAHDERVTLKTLETFKTILQTGDLIPSTRLEEALLSRFNSIMILDAEKKKALSDSAYSSMKDVYANSSSNENPFKNYFKIPHFNGYSAIDCLKHLQTLKSSRHLQIYDLASAILSNWFK